MGVLEEVVALKSKGISENEIANMMRNKGISPREVSDALSQATIKSAVSAEGGQTQEGMTPSMMRPEKAEPLPTEGELSDEDLEPPKQVPSFEPKKFRPSTKEVSENPSANEQQEYIPQPGAPGASAIEQPTYEDPGQEALYYPQEQEQQPFYGQMEQPQAQEYYPQESSYGYAESPAGTTDTMIEIAEQVFLEKMKSMKDQIDDLIEFKTLAETKIDDMSDRLKRIEKNIDGLQIEILEKVGSYGRGLDSVKKEMSMMQDSFGKVVNEMVHHPKKKHTTQFIKVKQQQSSTNQEENLILEEKNNYDFGIGTNGCAQAPL